MGAAEEVLFIGAVLLLLCTSNGLLNSKSQAGIMTLADGFNDFVAVEEDRSYNATLSDPPATTTTTSNYTAYEEEGAYELGGFMGKIAGKIRGKKGSNKKQKEKKRTFDVPLTVFGELGNVLVTPVSIGTPPNPNNKKNLKSVFFVGFDVAASNSWMYGVPTKSGEKQSKMDSASQTVRQETPYHSYNPLRSTTYTEVVDGTKRFTDAFFEGNFVSDSLELLGGKQYVDGFKFLSATTVHPISFANRAASFFDGLLGLGLKAEKEWRGITDPGDGTVGKKWVTVAGDKKYPGNSLFHRLAGGKNGGGVLKKPAVAFYVSPSGMSGEITFGGHKEKYLALVEGKGKKEAKREKMFYIPVVTSTPSIPDWTLKSHYLSVGPNKGGNLIAENFNVVFMTTVHHAFMTSSREIFKSLPSAFGEGVQVLMEGAFKDNYQLIVDCTARDNLAPLQLKFKSKLYKRVHSFKGEEVFPMRITGDPKYEGKCTSFFKLVTDFRDYGLPASSKDFEWAIGTDFMKKYYVEFSLSKRPDVPAYIAIGRSSKIKLKYRGLDRSPARAPSCPRSPGKDEKKEKFEAVLDPDSNIFTVTIIDEKGEEAGKVVDEGQSVAPADSDPSSSSSDDPSSISSLSSSDQPSSSDDPSSSSSSSDDPSSSSSSSDQPSSSSSSDEESRSPNGEEGNSDDPSSSSSSSDQPSSSSSSIEDTPRAPRTLGTGRVLDNGRIIFGNEDAVVEPAADGRSSSSSPSALPSSSSDAEDPPPPARSTNWRRWAAAGAMAACGAIAAGASSKLVGGRIITNPTKPQERTAVVYYDGDGRMMVGHIDENNHVVFSDAVPPRDAVRVDDLYGGGCKLVARGDDKWKLDCADGYGDGMWAYQFDE